MNAGEQEKPPTVRRVHHQRGDIRERHVSEILLADIAHPLGVYRGEQVAHVLRHWIAGQDARHATELAEQLAPRSQHAVAIVVEDGELR